MQSISNLSLKYNKVTWSQENFHKIISLIRCAHLWNIFSTLKEKFWIFLQPCNILYVSHNYLFFQVIFRQCLSKSELQKKICEQNNKPLPPTVACWSAAVKSDLLIDFWKVFLLAGFFTSWAGHIFNIWSALLSGNLPITTKIE